MRLIRFTDSDTDRTIFINPKHVAAVSDDESALFIHTVDSMIWPVVADSVDEIVEKLELGMNTR